MKHLLLATGMALAAFPALAAGQKNAVEDAFGGPTAVISDETLAVQRAKGEDAGISCVLCTANGTSTISGNAFQGASGVITVVQNTGNQVFLQTTTVVNVSIGR
jgi:hypothetical protein